MAHFFWPMVLEQEFWGWTFGEWMNWMKSYSLEEWAPWASESPGSDAHWYTIREWFVYFVQDHWTTLDWCLWYLGLERPPTRRAARP